MARAVRFALGLVLLVSMTAVAPVAGVETDRTSGSTTGNGTALQPTEPVLSERGVSATAETGPTDTPEVTPTATPERESTATTETVEDNQDRFTVEPVNRTVVAGQETTLELRITNVGEEVLRGIEGRAYDDSGYISDDEFSFERLAPGETGTRSLHLNVWRDVRAGTYPLVVDFHYERPDGRNEVSPTYNASIEVARTTAGAKTTRRDRAGFTVGVVIVAVAAATLLTIHRWNSQ